MQRICLLMCIALLSLFTESSVNARDYGMAGCGLGSKVMGKKGKFGQLLAATTNGYTGAPFSITSGTSGCTPDNKSAQLIKQEHFVVSNLSTLSKEIAQGQGPTLAALSETFGCDDEVQNSFNATLKNNYEEVFAAPGAIAVLDKTRDKLLENAEVTANCEFLVL